VVLAQALVTADYSWLSACKPHRSWNDPSSSINILAATKTCSTSRVA
jgi:hypothetical protein